jgi:MATE family multidrug resistance protein
VDPHPTLPGGKERRVTGKQDHHPQGGSRELLHLAIPFILSSSFMTLQITIDRALLSRSSSAAVAAAFPAALIYWTLFSVVQNIAGYATTFVAQYTGAGRPQRVGAVVWQALYFAVGAGVAFLALLPFVRSLLSLGGHEADIQDLEAQYLHCLCFAALPALIVAGANSFFAGRGASWTVLLIDATGLTVNAVLAYVWIFGRWGFPEMGIAGAGWATVAGSTTSALLALGLLFRPRHWAVYGLLTGWRFEADLFRRLLRFGLPVGLQWGLECLAFTVFLFLVGKLGKVNLAATNIAFTINMVAVLPMFGMGQAVAVLVGQRLGQDRPAVAERSTWTAFRLAWLFMGGVALLYVLVPQAFLLIFRSTDAEWPEVAKLVPVLLYFVAIYSLFDSMTLVFSFALRGAGDTRFVTAVSLALAWPIMVLPTWVALSRRWGLLWPWGFASAYVIAMGITFLLRFRAGKWKSMRVIEAAPAVLPQPVATADALV